MSEADRRADLDPGGGGAEALLSLGIGLTARIEVKSHRADSRVRGGDAGRRNVSYFVTGATGFIGRNLIELLLEREGTIYVLVREGSRGRLEELRSRWGDEEGRIVPIVGDLSQERLGCEDQISELKGKVEHFFHLAAIYDMTAD